MGEFSVQSIGTDSTDRAEQVKRYKEKYNAMMEGVGSFGATISNIWRGAAGGNIDLSGVSVFENNTCATNM